MRTDEVLAIHIQELRRGTVTLATLASLEQPRYGYALLEHLATEGIAVEGNTLYPLLRRLERQGLLTSEWNTDESRPRKFYRLTSDGRSILRSLTREWHSLSHAIKTLSRG